jgi:iron complex outermembrane receptor protein
MLFSTRGSSTEWKGWKVALLLGAGCATLPTELVLAQQSAAISTDSTTASTNAAPVGLEDIVVTATRRSENLQDVPMSITAVGAAQLQSRGITQTSDLQEAVPNLKISSQYGDTQPNFSLRGVGVANEFNTNTASPVGVYVDEVYQTYRFTHGLQLYDLDRVEVESGPQGTLYGRNTTGGAVNIFTQRPSLGATTGYVQWGYGNYDRKHVEGALEVTPINDVVGLRVAFTRSVGEGFWKEADPGNSLNHVNRYGTSDNVGTRATLLIKPSDSLEITAKAYYSKDDPIGTPIYTTGLIGGVDGTDFFGYSRQQAGLAYNQYQLDTQGIYYTRSYGALLNILYKFADWSITSVSGYSNSRFDMRIDNDGSPATLFDARYTADASDLSQDLRIAYNVDRVHLLAGVYYGKDSSLAVNTIRAYDNFADATSPATFNPGGSVNPAAPPTSLNVQTGYYQRRESAAVYTEDTYGFTDKLDVTLGLRYTHDKLQFLNAYSDAYQDVPGPLLFPLYGNLNHSNDENNVSGRLIANYKWTDGIRTYASFSRGYRAGTYNGFAYSAPSQVYFVEPETIDAFEVGAKTRSFDNRLEVNGAVFHYKYKNQQVEEIISAVGFLRSVNAAEIGAELNVLARPIENVTLRGSIGYLSSHYGANQYLSGTNIGGNTLPFASKWSFDLGGDWTVFDINAGKLVLSPEVNYVTKFYYDPFNGHQPGDLGLLLQPGASELLSQAGYALINGRLSFVAAHYTVGAWIKNAADKHYFPIGYDVTGAFGTVIRTPGAPRTFGIDAMYKF